ncbi:MAG: type IV secretion system protein [Telluria sp.]
MNGLFTFLTASIDSALSTYVTSVSAKLAMILAPLAAAALSIHYTLMGMAVMRGEADGSMPKLAWSCFKHMMIFGIALSAGAYQEWVVESVSATTSLLVEAASPSGATSLAGALDQMDAQGGAYAMVVLGHGMALMPVGGWLDILAGLVILVSNLVLMALVGIWGILAKVALTFVLAFGPLFISMLGFQPTAKFFDAWLGKVVNYMLLTVFMAAVTTFSMRIAGSFVTQITAVTDTSNSLSDAFGFALLSITLIVLTWQMPNIASGIAGGAAVSGPTGWVAAMMASMRGRSDKSDRASSASGGGEVTDTSGPGDPSSKAGSSKGRTPAYRRATLDRLSKRE